MLLHNNVTRLAHLKNRYHRLICFASFAMCCTSHMQLRSFVAHYYDCPWTFHDPVCVDVSLVDMEHWEMAGDWKDLCAVCSELSILLFLRGFACCDSNLAVTTLRQSFLVFFRLSSLSESADLVTVESLCVYVLWWNLGGIFTFFRLGLRA